MKIQKLAPDFSICLLESPAGLDLTRDFVFFARTDEEYSLVCPTDTVPENCIEESKGWKGFRIAGVLDFSLIGILSKISAVLAEEKIGIFAVSTFNTDYIFVKAENFEPGVAALKKAGYETE